MLSIRNILMCTGVGAVLAIVVLFAGVAARPGTQIPLPAADAKPMLPLAPATTAPATTAPATTAPATTKAPATTSASPKAAGTDERGFVGSDARCPDGQSAVAFGRTQRSLVAICPDGSGGYEYRGVRISDGATLITEAEATGDGTFVALNDGAEYTVSPSTLAVTSGGKVIYRDTWVDYQSPSFAAETGGPAATTSSAPTTTAKPR
ncbi:hypothetical protein [Mycobacterium sp. ACS4331]|uniref:hypothetical protein n=1 Tax=Mycobacterium sp. ACS4331 TaxID=1834121 RepID=UPI0007FD685A|nr:hypothetical protein [Mycobacterium sp. ACS4331]OBF11354.1 hypothetical protein A5727_20745 [Mycobacterium sp. ACS4331]